METIKLSKKVKIKDKEIDEIQLDFDKTTGNMLLNAEKMARTLGDETPSIMFSQAYQVCIASKISDPVLTYHDICSLPGKDFSKILMAVSRFLFQE